MNTINHQRSWKRSPWRLPGFACALTLLLSACAPTSESGNPTPTTAAAATPAAAATGTATTPPEEKCTNEPPTDENDKRPRCGGMSGATAPATRAYSIDVAGMGTTTSGADCVARPYDACDIDKPFSTEFCGLTLTHTPTSRTGGTFEVQLTAAGVDYRQSGTYTLSGPENRLTATYATAEMCAHTGGQALCVPQPARTTTWTRISDCKAAP